MTAAFALMLTLLIPSPAAHPTLATPAATLQPVIEDTGFCKPYNWLFGGWVAPPRIPLLADVNDDGYADFIYASSVDKSIDVSLNGKGWKPLRGQRLVSSLPQPIRALCAGHFGGRTIDLAILGSSGDLSTSLSSQAGSFAAAASLGTLVVAPGKVWMLAGKMAPGTLDDIVLVEATGTVRVYSAAGKLLRHYSLHARITDAATGPIDGAGRAELAVRIGTNVAIYPLDSTGGRIATVQAPSGEEALAVGDIDGDGKADLLIDGTVFLAPDFKKTVHIAGWEKFTKPVIAMMADVVGHGRGRVDVVVQHEGPDYFASTDADCDLYISYLKGDPDWDHDGLTNDDEAKIGSDPMDRSTSHDGILDGWKVHGFAGIDFPGMGASPLHKDVFVTNFPYDTVPVDQVEKYMRERIVPFFAALPYTNLDHTKGFAVHWMTQLPALPSKDNAGKSWEQIAGETFPANKKGLYHWMLINGLGGGGQSDQLAESGSTGMGSWNHEFGHQLGLSHSGKYASWAPTYTSIMDYSYSYQFEGSGEKVHFSTGEFANIVLNESHLPGRVPYPIDKLRFLEGPPYRLHLKAAGPDATYVDWAWTGVFADRKVRANITYGYGVSGGERLQPSGKQTFNYSGPYELMTDFQASLAEHHGNLYMFTVNRAPVDPKAPRPEHNTLVMQSYLGKHAWSQPKSIAADVVSDPFAASDGHNLYLFYSNTAGVRYRFGPAYALGQPQLLPNSIGAYPSAVNWKGSLILFLFRGPDKNITWRTVRGKAVGPESDLGFASTIPPGPAVDTVKGQLLLGCASPLGTQPFRWQLRRFTWTSPGRFTQVSSEFVGGDKSGWAGNRRPTLIVRRGKQYGPKGKLYWIATGLALPITRPTRFFVAQTIAYSEVNGGWLLWPYYDEWTNTHSGVAAAWNVKEKDITLATTWAGGDAGGDGGVFCAYNGTTIGNTDMGDYDDISEMANFGMSRSIGTFAVMPPGDGAGTPSSL